jgi:hypothetical protein
VLLTLAAFVVGLASIAALFLWASRRTATQHARFGLKDVEAALVEVLSPESRDHDTWDLFMGWPIDDPKLESVRQECLKIVKETEPTPGQDVGDEGLKRIAALLNELREGSQKRMEAW